MIRASPPPQQREARQLHLAGLEEPAPHQAGLAVDGSTAARQFDGDTIDHVFDAARLGRQLRGVLAALQRGGWWTLGELAAVAGGSEAGVSARIRDLRKPRFGAHRVERRRRGDPHAGLWEYAIREADRASARAADRSG